MKVNYKHRAKTQHICIGDVLAIIWHHGKSSEESYLVTYLDGRYYLQNLSGDGRAFYDNNIRNLAEFRKAIADHDNILTLEHYPKDEYTVNIERLAK
ncbi:Uncharacterized protein BCRIVMBC845_06412 [Bacillus cereus]|nr:Uncharacterized protein BCRIVMBC845_06412 [Bacillus cereus]